MAGPAVPIEVDPETGIWRTDGLPMIYLPRHFLVNIQKSVEEAIGADRFRGIMYLPYRWFLPFHLSEITHKVYR